LKRAERWRRTGGKLLLRLMLVEREREERFCPVSGEGAKGTFGGGSSKYFAISLLEGAGDFQRKGS